MHVMDSIENYRYKYRKAAWQVTILAHLFGVIAILLMLIWLLHYRGGLDLDSDNPNLIFNVHPFLMFFGFIFMAGQAMMAYKTIRAERKVQKIVHMFIHTIAICLGVVGLHAVFKFHERRNITNLYSLHSWIGITTFSLFCLQWLFGFSLFLFPRGSEYTRARAVPWHVFGGRALLYMAICTAETGLMEKVTFLQLQHHREARLINFLGFTILIFGITVDISAALTHFI